MIGVPRAISPLRRPRGGGKRGSWELHPDGSGTWTRHDRSAVRYRTVFKSGPAKHEIHTRTTYDADTGEELNITKNFDVCKSIDAELPSPRPRALRTVFSFNRTAATIPPDAVVHKDPREGPVPKEGSDCASAVSYRHGSSVVPHGCEERMGNVAESCVSYRYGNACVQSHDSPLRALMPHSRA